MRETVSFASQETARILWANKTAWSSLGDTKEEFLSLTIFDLNPKLQPHWDEIWAEIKEKQVVLDPKSEQLHKDGSITPVEVTATYQEIDGDEFVFSYVRDISDREVAQQNLTQKQNELEEALSQMQMMQDNIDYGIIFLNQALHIIATNQSARQIFQFTDQFLENQPHFSDMFDYIRKQGFYDMPDHDWRVI